MTTKNLYSIYDQQTRSFDAPFLSATDGEAERMFARIGESVPLMQSYPEDFSLHYVGTYDSEDGAIKPTNTVQKIINGLECIKVPSNLKSPINETSKISNDPSVQPST